MHGDVEKGLNVLKRAVEFLFYTNTHKAVLMSLDNVSALSQRCPFASTC